MSLFDASMNEVPVRTDTVIEPKIISVEKSRNPHNRASVSTRLLGKENGAKDGVARPLKRNLLTANTSTPSEPTLVAVNFERDVSRNLAKKRFIEASKKLRSENQEGIRRAEEAEKKRRNLENLSKAIRQKNNRRASLGHKSPSPSVLNSVEPIKEAPSESKRTLKENNFSKNNVAISEIFRKSTRPPKPTVLKPENTSTQLVDNKKYRPEEIKAYIELKKVKLAKQKRQERKHDEEMKRHRNDQIKLAEEFHKRGAITYRRMLERKKKRSRQSSVLESAVLEAPMEPNRSNIEVSEPDFLHQKVLVTDSVSDNNVESSALDETDMSGCSMAEERSHTELHSRFVDRIQKMKESARRLVLRVNQFAQENSKKSRSSGKQFDVATTCENIPPPKIDDIVAHTPDVSKEVKDDTMTVKPNDNGEPGRSDFAASPSEPDFAGNFDSTCSQRNMSCPNDHDFFPPNDTCSVHSEGLQDVISATTTVTTFTFDENDKERAAKMDWNIFGRPAPQFRPHPLSIINIFADRCLKQKEEIVLEDDSDSAFMVPRPPSESRDVIRAFSRSPKIRLVSASVHPGSSLAEKEPKSASASASNSNDLSVAKNHSEHSFHDHFIEQNVGVPSARSSEVDYTPVEDSRHDSGSEDDQELSERSHSLSYYSDHTEGIERDDSQVRLSPRSLALQATSELRYLDEISKAAVGLRELECSYSTQSLREASVLAEQSLNVFVNDASVVKSQFEAHCNRNEQPSDQNQQRSQHAVQQNAIISPLLVGDALKASSNVADVAFISESISNAVKPLYADDLEGARTAENPSRYLDDDASIEQIFEAAKPSSLPQNSFVETELHSPESCNILRTLESEVVSELVQPGSRITRAASNPNNLNGAVNHLECHQNGHSIQSNAVKAECSSLDSPESSERTSVLSYTSDYTEGFDRDDSNDSNGRLSPKSLDLEATSDVDKYYISTAATQVGQIFVLNDECTVGSKLEASLNCDMRSPYSSQERSLHTAQLNKYLPPHQSPDLDVASKLTEGPLASEEPSIASSRLALDYSEVVDENSIAHSEPDVPNAGTKQSSESDVVLSFSECYQSDALTLSSDEPYLSVTVLDQVSNRFAESASSELASAPTPIQSSSSESEIKELSLATKHSSDNLQEHNVKGDFIPEESNHKSIEFLSDQRCSVEEFCPKEIVEIAKSSSGFSAPDHRSGCEEKDSGFFNSISAPRVLSDELEKTYSTATVSDSSGYSSIAITGSVEELSDSNFEICDHCSSSEHSAAAEKAGVVYENATEPDIANFNTCGLLVDSSEAVANNVSTLSVQDVPIDGTRQISEPDDVLSFSECCQSDESRLSSVEQYFAVPALAQSKNEIANPELASISFSISPRSSESALKEFSHATKHSSDDSQECNVKTDSLPEETNRSSLEILSDPCCSVEDYSAKKIFEIAESSSGLVIPDSIKNEAPTVLDEGLSVSDHGSECEEDESDFYNDKSSPRLLSDDSNEVEKVDTTAIVSGSDRSIVVSVSAEQLRNLVRVDSVRILESGDHYNSSEPAALEKAGIANDIGDFISCASVVDSSEVVLRNIPVRSAVPDVPIAATSQNSESDDVLSLLESYQSDASKLRSDEPFAPAQVLNLKKNEFVQSARSELVSVSTPIQLTSIDSALKKLSLSTRHSPHDLQEHNVNADFLPEEPNHNSVEIFSSPHCSIEEYSPKEIFEIAEPCSGLVIPASVEAEMPAVLHQGLSASDHQSDCEDDRNLYNGISTSPRSLSDEIEKVHTSAIVSHSSDYSSMAVTASVEELRKIARVDSDSNPENEDHYSSSEHSAAVEHGKVTQPDIADLITSAILSDLVSELGVPTPNTCPSQLGRLTETVCSVSDVATAKSDNCTPKSSHAITEFENGADNVVPCYSFEKLQENSETKLEIDRVEQITSAILSDLVIELQSSVEKNQHLTRPVPLLFDVNNPECSRSYLANILEMQQTIDWSNPVLRDDLFDSIEKHLGQEDSSASSFRRLIFDMLQSVIMTSSPFGGKSPPESWHRMRPKKLSAHFWHQPSNDVLIKEVISRLYPDPSKSFDNVDDIVNSQVRQEEWCYDEHIADVQFEIADLIFSDILQDSLVTMI